MYSWTLIYTAKILKITRSQFACTSNFSSPLCLKVIPFKLVSSGLNIVIPVVLLKLTDKLLSWCNSFLMWDLWQFPKSLSSLHTFSLGNRKKYLCAKSSKWGGWKPVECCAWLIIPLRRDLNSKLMHLCDAAYSKLPGLWCIWGMTYAGYINLPLAWENLSQKHNTKSKNHIFTLVKSPNETKWINGNHILDICTAMWW
jgi:hypothetical protein